MFINSRLGPFLLVVLLFAPISNRGRSIRERILAKEFIWMQW
jgi:hypothetical protein